MEPQDHKLSGTAVGLNGSPHLVIRNDVGDLIGALNDGVGIEVVGNAGNYAADGMTAGKLVISGNVGDCAGASVSGGVLVIKGNAENYLGQLLKGGTIIVSGRVGDYAGSFMVSGVIVICGDAGRHLGASMVGGSIFIQGAYEKLEPTVHECKMTAEDKRLLTELSRKYELGLSIKGFVKICPKLNRMV